MRLLCPNCQQSITLPDSDASKTVTCPQCGKPFDAPQMYVPPPIESPATQPPPPPPPFTQIAPEPVPAASTPDSIPVTPPPATPAGYAHFHSITINRKLCEWLVPIALTLAFFLTFFKWAGLYPGGYSAYTQNAWQALFADFSVDPVAEKAMDLEKSLNEQVHSSWWLLPYLPLLMLAVLLSWAEPIIRTFQLKLPAVVEQNWKYRQAAISGCAGATLFFLLIQCVSGLGIQRAANAKVEATFKSQIDGAKTPEEVQKVEMEMAEKRGGYSAHTTLALKLAVLVHFLAVIGIAGDTLLAHRGNKPPPGIGVMW